MLDQYGRKIDYLRISVTDRCNLRCRYCMPEPMAAVRHEDILRYEEILRICRAAAELGITKFKVTGGEPLVRAGCTEFIAELKKQPGTEQVTLTTNGLLLEKNLDALASAGLDGVNISLDTTDNARFRSITGYTGDGADTLLRVLKACCANGLHTKINAVLLEETEADAPALAAIAEALPVDVRFIELMPIGFGTAMKRVSPEDILAALKERWPDLTTTDEKRGNGPAHYYKSAALLGRIGFIDAVSHKFCAECNRVRLTSTGRLKPCLCYADSADLRALIRGGCTDDELKEALRAAVYAKPRAHCFGTDAAVTEKHMMSQIGG